MYGNSVKKSVKLRMIGEVVGNEGTILAASKRMGDVDDSAMVKALQRSTVRIWRLQNGNVKHSDDGE